jgi:hypothetical protein
MLKPYFTIILAVVSMFCAPAFAGAVDGPLAAYVAADVVAVGSIDLAKLDFNAALDEAAKLGLPPEAELQTIRAKAAALQQALRELTKLGATRAYALLRATDLSAGGTSWLIEVDDASHAAAVAELLKAWSAQIHGSPQQGDFSQTLPKEFAAAGNVVLGAPSAEALESLKHSADTAPRDDATAALAALAEADAGVVAFGDSDSRRVVREMFPATPAPFMEIDGRLLADGVAWGGVLLKLPPGPTVTVTLEAATPAALATLEGAVGKGLELLKALCIVEAASGPPAHKARAAALLPIVPHLKPLVEGSRLTLTIGDDQAEVGAVHSLLVPALASTREAASRQQRMNNFKQIAVGMHMYEDRHKSLPAAASYDANGKPLLSWRVHLLPYLEQQALYDEFHLDEPWNSEHNAKLIPRMPAIYADPGLSQLAAEGRTTYCVPTGPGTIFEGREGSRFKDVIDGLSNTVLVVEVTPANAVVWTKPDDWEVAPDDPLRGVKREAGDVRGDAFAVALSDGSCRMISSNIDPKLFAAVLTRAGREVVPYPLP